MLRQEDVKGVPGGFNGRHYATMPSGLRYNSWCPTDILTVRLIEGAYLDLEGVKGSKLVSMGIKRLKWARKVVTGSKIVFMGDTLLLSLSGFQ